MVSNDDPAVVTVACAAADGVHAYQTEWPPGSPRIVGSPGSRVADAVEPRTRAPSAGSATAAANASFGAASASVQRSSANPYDGAAPGASRPSTWIRYRVPATVSNVTPAGAAPAPRATTAAPAR